MFDMPCGFAGFGNIIGTTRYVRKSTYHAGCASQSKDISPEACHALRISNLERSCLSARLACQWLHNSRPKQREKNMATCEILSVGTELLLGQILNTNSRYLSEELALLG